MTSLPGIWPMQVCLSETSHTILCQCH